MLKISDVVQEFRTGFFRKRTIALKGVSLVVPEKSVFGFLGHNGAGKTTLIQAIVGNREPVSGSVTLNGIPTNSVEARQKLGYLPERPYFYSHLTAERFLRHFAILSDVPEDQISSRIKKTLESVSLLHAIDKELGHFSKGMLQRIGIGQAILHDPDFIVLDEPMSGLDPNGRRDIRELIHQLSREGKTIFFSTHVVSDVEAICDRVAIIDHGEIRYCGKISELVDPKTKWIEIGVLKQSKELPEPLKEYDCHSFDDLWIVKMPLHSQWNEDIKRWIERGLRIQFATPRKPSLEELL